VIPGALRRRRGSLAWLIAILALGALLLWLATVPLLRGTADDRGGSLVGKPAPELTAQGIDGEPWSLADVDDRIVWVNFWAISCEPCRTEMPAMERLAAEHPDDLLVLGVNWGEDRDSVAGFVERYGITYPIILDPGLETYYRWAGTDGLPRHYFVGEAGTVLREIVGPLEPARMVEVVEELLAARGSG
jgi:thiol-disulfide isomerase/thioredoxin